MPGGARLEQAMQRQQARVELDTLIVARNRERYLDNLAIQHAAWAEALEEAGWKKHFKANKELVRKEIHHADRAVVAVRRAALRAMLQREHDEFAKELHAQGKAFYVKRT